MSAGGRDIELMEKALHVIRVNEGTISGMAAEIRRLEGEVERLSELYLYNMDIYAKRTAERDRLRGALDEWIIMANKASGLASQYCTERDRYREEIRRLEGLLAKYQSAHWRLTCQVREALRKGEG